MLNYFIFELQDLIKKPNYRYSFFKTKFIYFRKYFSKKIKKGSIDFYKPFYENLPTG